MQSTSFQSNPHQWTYVFSLTSKAQKGKGKGGGEILWKNLSKNLMNFFLSFLPLSPLNGWLTSQQRIKSPISTRKIIQKVVPIWISHMAGNKCNVKKKMANSFPTRLFLPKQTSLSPLLPFSNLPNFPAAKKGIFFSFLSFFPNAQQHPIPPPQGGGGGVVIWPLKFF